MQQVSEPAADNVVPTRQQVLILHLTNKSLDSQTVAWALYDGAALDGCAQQRAGDGDDPPYQSGLDALKDNWKLLQLPPITPVPTGREHDTSELPFEFAFVREAELHA